VLAIGLAASALRRLRPRLDMRLLALLFALTTGLGTLARAWSDPTQLIASSGTWATAGIAALTSVVLNNLPAAVLFSAHPPLHPHALLLRLDLGPNLAVIGSLSAVLWLQAARAVDADASIASCSRLGALLVPLTLAAALTARGL
jgi:arsenical pump membrane protein